MRLGQSLFLIVCFLAIVSSCGSRESQSESKKVAEDSNDEKFDTKAGEKDAQFVVDAISNSMAEVRLTELAEQRAIDPSVKTAAIALNKEHNALIATLKEYASRKAISIPEEASSSDKSKVEKLVSAKNFDKEWCKEAQDVNKETIDAFESGTTSLSDPELKNWLTQVLPTVRKAHDQVMACETRLR